MAPARDVMAAGIGEQAEMHLPPRHVLFPLRRRSGWARAAGRDGRAASDARSRRAGARVGASSGTTASTSRSRSTGSTAGRMSKPSQAPAPCHWASQSANCSGVPTKRGTLAGVRDAGQAVQLGRALAAPPAPTRPGSASRERRSAAPSGSRPCFCAKARQSRRPAAASAMVAHSASTTSALAAAPDAHRPCRHVAMQDHRLALHRTRHVERPAHGEEPAGMLDRMHVSGIGESAARLVDDEAAILPAVPELARDVDQLDQARRRVLFGGGQIGVAETGCPVPRGPPSRRSSRCGRQAR